ncbi:NADH dehydrogenase 1 beta subcomplex subunit 3 [Leucosporidium creatinivorum]|uniref:NADH dehydrogenase 1 beta subcomplex subunit 3 n=1 Tax=Leucosporidium creatinivorum TaxID=106004 RepID=A0A1Y2DFG0_9BASI|nr:NADH dehydrogenase 1 beta subcomplex subunit 3 [Leucosporidium creatinivorum]
MSQPLYRDPWAKREAWRKSAIFTNKAMFRNLFPGFGIAVVAFSAYVAYDNTVSSAKATASEHH